MALNESFVEEGTVGAGIGVADADNEPSH